MNARRLAMVTAAVALVIAVSGAFLWRSSQRRPASPPPRVVAGLSRAVDADVAAVDAAAQRIKSAPRLASTSRTNTQLPPSLEGTEVDGWLGVDDDGHLVVTPGARFFFDYFLSATGEVSQDEIRAQIIAEIETRLSAAGAQQAIALLDRYLTYRERVRALQDSDTAMDLRERLAQLHTIRRETFGDADAAALFGDEEQVLAVDAQRRAILLDTTQSPQEREAKIHELEQQLPAGIREARAAALGAAAVMHDEQLLRESGASTEEVRALRTQQFGTEAAERLAALDRERLEWQQRLDDYRAARQAVASDASLTADARAHAIDELLATRFTSDERLRVQALDDRHNPSGP